MLVIRELMHWLSPEEKVDLDTEWNAREDGLEGERLENMGGNPGRTREDLFGIVPLEASGSLSLRDYQDSDYITDTSNEKGRE